MDRQLIPHSRPTIGSAETEAAAAAVSSGWLAGGGPRSQYVGRRLADLVGAQAGQTVASGTIAIEAALRVIGVGGSEVAVPAYGCSSIRRAILRAGAQPRELDVRRADLGFNPDRLARDTRSCAAMVLVHQFGVPASAREVLETSGVPMAEDITTTIGGARDGTSVGGVGRLTVLSMAATKMVCGGEGGAVLGSVADIDIITDWVAPESELPDATMAGRAAMSEVACAVAGVQLDRLEEFVARRELIAEHFCGIADEIGIEVLRPRPVDRGTWWRFLVILDRGSNPDRCVQRAAEGAVAFARPVAPSPSHRAGVFPVADRLVERVVSVPLYPGLTDVEVSRVGEAMRSSFA